MFWYSSCSQQIASRGFLFSFIETWCEYGFNAISADAFKVFDSKVMILFLVLRMNTKIMLKFIVICANQPYESSGERRELYSHRGNIQDISILLKHLCGFILDLAKLNDLF